MNKAALFSLLASSMLASAAPAEASLVYASFPDIMVPDNGDTWCSSCNGDWRVYDVFTVSQSTTLTKASFRIADWYDFPTMTTVSINADNGGVVGAELFSADIDPFDFLEVGPAPYSTASVTVALPGWAVVAGSYWFSVYNPYDLAFPGFAKPGGVLFHAYGADPAAGGETRADEAAAFALYDDLAVPSGVPEPASWALMMLGLGAVGGAMRGRARVSVGFG